MAVCPRGARWRCRRNDGPHPAQAHNAPSRRRYSRGVIYPGRACWSQPILRRIASPRAWPRPVCVLQLDERRCRDKAWTVDVGRHIGSTWRGRCVARRTSRHRPAGCWAPHQCGRSTGAWAPARALCGCGLWPPVRVSCAATTWWLLRWVCGSHELHAVTVLCGKYLPTPVRWLAVWLCGTTPGVRVRPWWVPKCRPSVYDPHLYAP